MPRSADPIFSVGNRPLKIAVFEDAGETHLAVITSGNQADPTGDEDRLTFLLNRGDGSFVRDSQSIFVGNGALDLAVGDVDGDNRLDIAVSNFRSDKVTLLRNSGSFQFTLSEFDVGADPVDVDLVDISGDNRLDIITANSASQDVTILRNQGGGGFGGAQTLPAGLEPAALVSGDINNDGRRDLLVANYLSDDVSIFLNNNGQLVSAGRADGGARPKDILLGDVDLDGEVEVVTANSEQGELTIVDLAFQSDGTVSTPVDVCEFRWWRFVDRTGRLQRRLA